MIHSLAWLILMVVDVCQQGEDQRLPPPPSSPTSELQCQCWLSFYRRLPKPETAELKSKHF